MSHSSEDSDSFACACMALDSIVAPSCIYKAAHTGTESTSVVKPSPVPHSQGTRVGFLSHIGHSSLRTAEERIHMIKLILSPDWIGSAPCLCCPR